MRLRPFRLVPVLVAVMLLLVPALAAAQGEPTDQDIAINTLLVFFAESSSCSCRPVSPCSRSVSRA